MTFLPSTSYSDFPTDQNFRQFHYLDADFDLHRITSGFKGAFASGVTFQYGTLNLSHTRFPQFLGPAYDPIVTTSCPEIAVFPDYP